jgi:hypothetical protein
MRSEIGAFGVSERSAMRLLTVLASGRIVPELVDKVEAEGEPAGLSFIADPLK